MHSLELLPRSGDIMLALGIVVVLVALIALLVISRIRKRSADRLNDKLSRDELLNAAHYKSQASYHASSEARKASGIAHGPSRDDTSLLGDELGLNARQPAARTARPNTPRTAPQNAPRMAPQAPAHRAYGAAHQEQQHQPAAPRKGDSKHRGRHARP